MYLCMLCRCGFLTKWPMVGAVLVPTAIVILCGAVIFIMVMRRLSKKVAGKQTTMSSREELLRRFQNALSFIVLLGLTWVVGFLTVIQTPEDNDVELVFDIIFIILNSLQGVFLFFFYCLRNPVDRASWRRMFQRFLPIQKSMGVSTTGTGQSRSDHKPTTEDTVQRYEETKSSRV